MSVMYISGGIYEQMNDMCIYMESNESRKVCVRVCVYIYIYLFIEVHGTNIH
jgi:hypothetical protein